MFYFSPANPWVSFIFFCFLFRLRNIYCSILQFINSFLSFSSISAVELMLRFLFWSSYFSVLKFLFSSLCLYWEMYFCALTFSFFIYFKPVYNCSLKHCYYDFFQVLDSFNISVISVLSPINCLFTFNLRFSSFLVWLIILKPGLLKPGHLWYYIIRFWNLFKPSVSLFFFWYVWWMKGGKCYHTEVELWVPQLASVDTRVVGGHHYC